jgi:nicotinate-nucleotide adenylyltransferase
MSRIGIFSGTFDPVHLGHLEFCLLALEKGGLDKVVLLPEHTPRSKHGVLDFAHRVEMLRLAAAEHHSVEVRVLKSRQFTVSETLSEIRELFPGDELVMLVGSDVVKNFERGWENLADLLAEVSLIIGLREQETTSEIDEVMRQLEIPCEYLCVQSPRRKEASSRVRQGDFGATHPAVREYIAKKKLYFYTKP